MQRIAAKAMGKLSIAVMLLGACAFGVVVGQSIGVSIAQTIGAAPADAGTVISLKGIVGDYVLPALGSALVVFIGWVLRKVDGVLGLQMTQQNRAVLEGAIENAIRWGQEKAGSYVQNGSLLDFRVKNAVVANAANYLIAFTPGTLSTFGITKESLPALVEARMARLMGGDLLEQQANGPSQGAPAAAPVVAPAPPAASGGPATVPVT